MTVTSEECRLCSLCLLPCQWWKNVCGTSPVSQSWLDLDTSCSCSWPLSLSPRSGLDLPSVKAVTIVKTVLHNWTVTKIFIKLENSADFLRRPFRMCLWRISLKPVNGCCHSGHSDEESATCPGLFPGIRPDVRHRRLRKPSSECLSSWNFRQF